MSVEPHEIGAPARSSLSSPNCLNLLLSMDRQVVGVQPDAVVAAERRTKFDLKPTWRGLSAASQAKLTRVLYRKCV
jgi:hypothetical protein